ncbi:hypothetical protein AAEU32_01010 [Pseudoalteromonas sp. SSDWG2]|uniref:hypothetical protein n=1 Tax=Pseudoalteromonas sp. SSDWG2 TaxID=3139391 RepID=UPI003BA9D8CD
MLRRWVITALLLGAAFTLDSLLAVPVFGVQWYSPEFMASIIPTFNLIKLLVMAIITGFLWWAVPKLNCTPFATMAMQFVALMCAVHVLLLFAGRQSVIDTRVNYQSVGQFTVMTSQEQQIKTHTVYLLCKETLGFYSLIELMRRPYFEGAYVAKKGEQWYFFSSEPYALADASNVQLACK